MTCKDCTHYVRCKDIYDNSNKTFGIWKNVFDDEMYAEYGCSFFADKSLFVELPCKVGDTAYIDLSDKGDYYDECKVKHIEFSSDWTEPLFTLICYEKADYRTYWLSDFGKEWFLYPTERTKKKKR